MFPENNILQRTYYYVNDSVRYCGSLVLQYFAQNMIRNHNIYTYRI